MFINNDYIFSLLLEARKTGDSDIDRILDKAEQFMGLNHTEVASLMQTGNPRHIERMFEISGKIKRYIYGNRVVMFAPLYVSNYCINQCDYCGYKCSNKFSRRRLTMDELRNEIKVLEKMGHKRLALEAGEDPVHADIEYILACLKTIYETKLNNGEIRRVNVNIAATSVENYKMLKNAGIGTYILFQETYHKPTYEEKHISGPKNNYEYHLTAFDRAMEAGIDDVGAGVLFGLYDWKYEVLSLMLHNEHLEKKYGVGFHTVSVPRLCKAQGFDMLNYPHLVDDDDFTRLVAILRLAVPFTGMIISTRETAEMRSKLIKIGVSQMSGGSSVDVGGYTRAGNETAQFSVSDERSAYDIVRWLISQGLIPSFCTACYRKGRTGDRFMQLAKSGNIKNVCHPNALQTLVEYAVDCGDSNFLQEVLTLCKSEINVIENEKIKLLTKKNISKILNGERDLYI